MPRRMGRPGLMGTMARTAVVAGTATAVSGSVRSKQDAKAQAAVPQQPTESAPPPPPAAAAEPAAAPSDDLIDQLEKLADMKADGLLDDAEFASAKARLLGR